jgi:hypothetical protein
MTTRLNMTGEQRNLLTLVIDGVERWNGYTKERGLILGTFSDVAFDLYIRAYTLGITSMLDDQVQHYAYQYLMKLDSDDLIFDEWGIDPENRAEAFPYYQAAA